MRRLFVLEGYSLQIKLHQGIPFEVKVPNKVTLKTFKDTDQGKNLIHPKNVEHMFDQLEL